MSSLVSINLLKNITVDPVTEEIAFLKECQKDFNSAEPPKIWIKTGFILKEKSKSKQSLILNALKFPWVCDREKNCPSWFEDIKL